jgi:TPR repeat protein
VVRESGCPGRAAEQHNLGLLYVYGQGVLQNDVRAYMWWSLAAASMDDVQKLAIDN